ncbi:MAG: hypothetical protein IMZ61_06420 [Planctomycetes bacterium]|nr:hypothetical protein [Planctomycetota bacterium]
MSNFPTTLSLSFRQALEISATQKCPLGTRGVAPDGRIFRYALNGAVALVAGLPVTPAAQGELACINTSHAMQLVAGTTIRTTQNVFKIGGSYDDAGLTANAYAEGFLLVGSTWDVGAPMRLKIKSHTAQTSNTSAGSCATDDHAQFTLEDGVFPTTCINTSMGFGLEYNPYSGTLVAPTNSTIKLPVIGVPIRAVDASYYYWCQTWGDCMVRFAEVCTSGLTLGRKVIMSADVNTTGVYCVASSNYVSANDTGDVSDAAFYTIGLIQSPAPAGGYGVVNLRISP